MKVRDIMTRDVVIADKDDTVLTVAKLMKHHALVVGSPAFLRLWAVLGCEEKTFSEFMTAQELLLWGSEAHVDIVLYEEKLFDNFSS